MRLLHRLKYRFSEPYRIRKGRGLSPIRNKREYRALIAYCREQLKKIESMESNPERKKVYAMTILLHQQSLSPDPEVYTKLHSFKLPNMKNAVQYNDVDDFIADHVAWYWD